MGMPEKASHLVVCHIKQSLGASVTLLGGPIAEFPSYYQHLGAGPILILLLIVPAGFSRLRLSASVHIHQRRFPLNRYTIFVEYSQLNSNLFCQVFVHEHPRTTQLAVSLMPAGRLSKDPWIALD